MIQKYLEAICESGGVVNSAKALGAARGIILKTSRYHLPEYGGNIILNKDWAKALLQRMECVKISKSKNVIECFDELKADLLQQVQTMVAMEDIPAELILNWDQTGINIVPSSTMDDGSKGVMACGVDWSK